MSAVLPGYTDLIGSYSAAAPDPLRNIPSMFGASGPLGGWQQSPVTPAVIPPGSQIADPEEELKRKLRDMEAQLLEARLWAKGKE